MARWFSEILAVSADAIFPLIAEFVAGGTGWDLYDDISAHIKVYRCTGGAVTFYVEVDHTTASTVIIKLATGWDNVNHVYTGYKSGAQYLSITVEEYAINGDESTFYIMGMVWNSYKIIYVGYTTPLDILDTTSICLSGQNSAMNSYGAFASTNNGQLWLYNKTEGFGGIMYCQTDLQMQYGYNPDLGMLYLSKLKLANIEENKAYRASPKFIYPACTTLPTGFAGNDGILIGGLMYRLRYCNSANSFLWVQWE